MNEGGPALRSCDEELILLIFEILRYSYSRETSDLDSRLELSDLLAFAVHLALHMHCLDG